MRRAIVNLIILCALGLSSHGLRADVICPNVTILVSTDPGLCSANVTIPLPEEGPGSTITFITHDSPIGTPTDPSGVYPILSTPFEYTVTYTVSGGASQTETCQINVIVEDNEAPEEPTCPPNTTITDCADAGNMAETIQEFMAQGGVVNFENCGYDHTMFTAEESIIPIIFSDCEFQIRRRYTVRDNYPGLNNFNSCTQSILVRDEVPPEATCPTSQTGLDCTTALPDGVESISDFIALGGAASDNCLDQADLTLTFEDDSDAVTSACDTDGNPLVVTRTYTIEDDCGNGATCTQTFTYLGDDEAPSITCPSNATNLSCDDTLPLAEASLVGTDNCDTATSFSVTNASDGDLPDTFCGATVTRVYTVEDACGNESTCEQTFTFASDTEAPDLTCPDDIALACNADLPAAETSLIGSDNCDAATSYSVVAVNGARPASYCATDDRTMTRIYSAFDSCDNKGECTQTITFTADTADPTFTETPPASINIACFDDAPTYDLLEATDDCDTEVDVVLSIDPPLGTLCEEGTYTYTWTATDDCGNATTASTTVIRDADLLPPMDIVCIPDAEIACNAELPDAISNLDDWFEGAGELADNCTFGDIVITSEVIGDPSTFSFCPAHGPFEVIRRYTFTDGCDLSASCDQTITYTPNTEPFTIACATEPRVFINDPGECHASLELTPPTVTGVCTALASTELIAGGVVQTGPRDYEACFEETVIWRFTDACGTVQECEETIFVKDIEPPSFVCDGDQVISLSNTNVVLGFEHFLEAGTIQDNCNNENYVVTVRRMADNCGLPANLEDGESVEFCCGDIGEEVMVLVTVTDDKGNANTCMVVSTVSDKNPPTLACPSHLEVECNLAFDLEDLGATFGQVVQAAEDRGDIIIDGITLGLDGIATDPCGIASLTETYDDSALNCNKGLLTRTFTATDQEGNVNTCTQQVNIVDNDPFDADDITIPENIERDLGCTTTPPTPEELGSEPTFTGDQCAHVFYTYDDDVFKYPDSGCMHIIREYTVIDWCQNNEAGYPPAVFGPFNQHITLINTDEPTVTSCDPVEFCAGDASCVADVTLMPSGSDPCTPPEDLVWTWILDVGNDGQDFISGSGSGTQYFYTNSDGADVLVTGTGSGLSTNFGIGVHSVQWTVDDNCGNTNTCTQMITVKDCKSPNIACIQGLAVALVDMSPMPPMVELWASDFDASTFDNCTPQDEISFIFESTGNGNITFTCADVGTQTVTIIAIDNDGNESRCNTTVNVQDSDASVTEVNLQVCAGRTVSYTIPDGTTVDLGPGTYTYADDTNVGTCAGVINVTVAELANPTVTITPPAGCVGDLDAYGVSPAGGLWTNASGGIVSGMVPEGTYTYTYIDANGCTGSASTTIDLITAGTIARPNGDTEIAFCTDNAGQDFLILQEAGSTGANNAWVITDASGNILVIPASFPYSFSGTPAGTCFVRNITYENGLQGLTVGSNLDNLAGCWAASNVVTVTKYTRPDCRANCDEIQGGCIDVNSRIAFTSEKCSDSNVSFTAEVCNDMNNPATEIVVVTAYTEAFDNPTNIVGPAGSTYEILDNNAIQWSVPSLSGQCVDMHFDLSVVEDAASHPYEVVVYVVSTNETDVDSYPSSMTDSDSDGSLMDELSGEDDEAGVHVEMQSCIDNFVWFDANENGIVDNGEAPMANVEVCLYKLENNALVTVACYDTGSNGRYEFCNLTAGEYRLGFPTSLSQGGQDYILTQSDASGSSGQLGDVDVDSDPYVDSGVTLSYNVSNGECETRVGAGYIQYVECSVTGDNISFADGSNVITFCTDDGVLDTPALADDNAGGTFNSWIVICGDNNIFTYVNNASSLNFEGYEAGTCYIYRVSYEDGLVGLNVGSDFTQLDGCYSLSNALTVHKQTGNDCPPPPCSVTGSNIVFADGSYAITFCTDDGVLDTPVLGNDIATGTYNSWAVVDDQNNIITYVNSASSLNFEGYSAGTCYVYRVSYEDGLVGLNVGSDITALDGCYSLSNPLTIYKQTGDDCPPPPCEASATCINGSLWIDTNESGLRDGGDLSLSYLPVCLYTVTNNMLIYHSCTESSPSGTYSFCGLPMGSYSIGVPPNVLIDDIQHMLVDVSDHSEVYPNTGFTSTMTLEPEHCTEEVSAGYKAISEDVCTVDGGNVYLSNNVVEIIVCVDDGQSDLINLTLDNAIGSNGTWTISNGNGTIIGLSNSPQFDFEGEDQGVCLIRHVSHGGDIEGLIVGASISNLEGCFDLSNVFIVNKLTGANCNLFDTDPTTEEANNGGKISGKVYTEDKLDIQDAELSISTNGMQKKQMTNAQGEYAFSSLEMYKDYNLTPQKNNDMLNGVSVIDIVIIQQHILGIENLTSPYDLIAADINNSQSISATDLVTLRKVILGVLDEFPNNTSWRFVNSAYEFADPDSPWTFEEDMKLNELDAHYDQADFIGVKVGDVNGTVSPNAKDEDTKGREEVKFMTYEERQLTKGSEVSIPIYGTENINSLGFQFTLNLGEGVNFLNVVGANKSWRDIHYAFIDDEKVTISWSNYKANKIEDGKPVFSIKLWVEQDIKVSEAIEITSDITPAYLYEGSFEEYQLGLKAGAASANSFQLYQNKPNPFGDATEINFSLAKADKVFLLVRNVYGQTLFSKEIDGQSGKNSIEVKRSDLKGNQGLMYYSITVGDEQKTGNMIMLK